MKKYVFLILVVLLLSGCSGKDQSNSTETPTTSEEPEREVEITYVGNTGFLITVEEKKILIDIPRSGFGYVFPPDVQELIEQALPPFDDVDVILVTHNHADHYNPTAMGGHMRSNPNAVFVSTEQVTSAAQRGSLFEGVEDRIMTAEPEEGETIEFTANGIELEILNMPHGPGAPLTNIGFIITVDGVTIFHTGDIGVPYSDIQSYDFPSKNIDIALVPYFYFIENEWVDPEQASQFIKDVDVQGLIAMHLLITDMDFDEIIERIHTEFPDAIVFEEEMETKNVLVN